MLGPCKLLLKEEFVLYARIDITLVLIDMNLLCIYKVGI